LSADISFDDGYPVVANDPAEAAFAAEVAHEVLGPERFFQLPRPLTASEDFSHVADRRPAAYLLLGACSPDHPAGADVDDHSPLAVFDDSMLADGAALLAALALRRLASAAGRSSG